MGTSEVLGFWAGVATCYGSRPRRGDPETVEVVMRDSRRVELFEGATVLLTMPCSRSNESARCFCGTVIAIHESIGRVTVAISEAVRATVPATSVTIADPTLLAPWNEAVTVTRALLSEHCAPPSAFESVAWAKKHLDALTEGGE